VRHSLCVFVCLFAASRRHYSNDVITSPADCVLFVTSPAGSNNAGRESGQCYRYSY